MHTTLINNNENIQQFKLINRLTKKKYQKIDFNVLLENIKINENFATNKFYCASNKIKFEKKGQDITLHIKVDMILHLENIIKNLSTNVVNLIIDLQKTRYFQSTIHNLDKYFDNLPVNLKTIIFIFPSGFTRHFSNEYGYLNFLFCIKKLPFNLTIKICIDNLLYELDCEQNLETIKLSNNDVIHSVNYNPSKSNEVIHYV